MIKTLQNAQKQEKQPLHIPRSVQEAIPIRQIWDNGIFLAGGKYSQSYRFTDINFAIASKEDKEAMFLDYSELLNSLDTGATAKITINNRRLNRSSFERDILIPTRGDSQDSLRREYNAMILDKATGANSIVQEKYITISAVRKNGEEAKAYFSRVSADLSAHFSRMSSHLGELDAGERLRVLHDFFRIGEEADFRYSTSETARKGHSFKDTICPDTLEFERDYFRMGDKYGRVLFLREYANYIKDSMITELCGLPRNLMLSIDILPIPTDEAVREIENKLLGVETNITNWQRRQNNNNNFSAVIPYDMELQRKETKEFLDDLTTRDQRMMFGLVTLVHIADTKEQLDADTETLLAIARKNLCQLAVLKWQQADGLNTVLPFGVRKIEALLTLTTESTAVLIPFWAQEIMEPGGAYYGQNAISRNLLLCKRTSLLNGNGFYLGVPGSGKSFGAKQEISYVALATDDDILICDPEREYTPLAQSLGGEVIHIAAGSPNHINAMDMVQGYGEKDPIIEKSEFILSLFEQVTDHLGAKEKSIIDRCIAAVYRNYQSGGPLPRLPVLREELLAQPEPEAQSLALSAELFTNGSLDTFAYPTNVNTQSRIVVYDILDLGKQLKTLGLLVITDAMLNRVTLNWKQGKRTHIFIDEFHVVFENEYSGGFFSSAWRRFPKRNGFVTGITQNVEYLLGSDEARTMLSNSEFIMMFNQAATDRAELAKLLNISGPQLSYVTNVDSGHGLMRFGRSLVPFIFFAYDKPVTIILASFHIKRNRGRTQSLGAYENKWKINKSKGVHMPDIKQKPPGKLPCEPDKQPRMPTRIIKTAAALMETQTNEPEQQAPAEYATDQVTQAGKTAADSTLQYGKQEAGEIRRKAARHKNTVTVKQRDSTAAPDADVPPTGENAVPPKSGKPEIRQRNQATISETQPGAERQEWLAPEQRKQAVQSRNSSPEIRQEHSRPDFPDCGGRLGCCGDYHNYSGSDLYHRIALFYSGGEQWQ